MVGIVERYDEEMVTSDEVEQRVRVVKRLVKVDVEIADDDSYWEGGQKTLKVSLK